MTAQISFNYTRVPLCCTYPDVNYKLLSYIYELFNELSGITYIFAGISNLVCLYQSNTMCAARYQKL